jgi:hypothetical protein
VSRSHSGASPPRSLKKVRTSPKNDWVDRPLWCSSMKYCKGESSTYATANGMSRRIDRSFKNCTAVRHRNASQAADPEIMKKKASPHRPRKAIAIEIPSLVSAFFTCQSPSSNGRRV